jgi:hypothetical protein
MTRISKVNDVKVHLYGKPNNYSLAGFDVNGVTAPGDRIAAINAALRNHLDVTHFLAPHPGTGDFVSLADLREVPNSPLRRGTKGDIVELGPGQAYVVSAADCIVGYLSFGKKTFAFHAGWQELVKVIDFFTKEITKNGSKPKVSGAFGFSIGSKHMTLELTEDQEKNKQIQKVLDLASEAGSLQILNGENHICLDTIFAFNIRKACHPKKPKLLHLASNTKDRKKWWSNRLDGKGPNGENQSNLIIIHNKAL